jgi:transposase
MSYKYFVGVDVSKATLDFAVLNGKELIISTQTSNDFSGLRDFMKQMKASLPKLNLEDTIFCMEHTGVYNEHLLDFLSGKGANICLEVATHIKMSSGLQRGKNDKIDAIRIAQYAYRNRDELKLWQPKREVVQQLKTLSGVRNRLINAKKQLTVALHETASFDNKASVTIKVHCQSSLKAIDNDIAKTEKAMEKVIASDEQLSRLFEIITSVKGIGKVTATEMIITTNEFKNINDPKKFACYSGIAPFEHISGSSVKGKSRVSHKANKAMKTLLHMAAITAVNYNIDLKSYYQKKLLENKNKMTIINAVRNKLVHRVFACVKNNRLYQNKYNQILV